MLPRDVKWTKAPETSHVVRRQLNVAENMRFLRRLPGFEVDRELPTQFLQLLGKLHQTEDETSRQSRRHRRKKR